MSYFVRMIEDRQIVGIYSPGTNPADIPHWADEVVNHDLCEVTFQSPWGINWSGHAPSIGSREDNELAIISDAILTEDTHAALMRAKWWPINKLGEFCYFVEMNRRVKIGRTTNMRHRLYNFASGSPDQPVLLGAVWGGLEEERSLHRQFADLRVNNEWFEHKGALREFLREPTIRAIGKGLAA